MFLNNHKKYTVSQINKYIKLVLDDDAFLDNIYIEGEISNIRHHSTGHIYFTIKDEECSIQAIIYKDIDIELKEELLNGDSILCFGSISLYNKTGYIQIIVKDIKRLGFGKVYTDFEMLKQKLKKEGLFDSVYKMELPSMPSKIGIITSDTGAGLRDMIKVAKQINKGVKLFVIPALVQGDYAPDSIINAIELANMYKELDIIILARGGGSKEDLECFNAERLARAIFYSSIPIVTGIGHEIDFTIADFVADFRAPTPSSAMEICLKDFKIIRQEIENYVYFIDRQISQKIMYNKMRIQNAINMYSINILEEKIARLRNTIENEVLSIDRNIESKIYINRNITNSLLDKIELNSPTNIIKKGYTRLYNDKGDNIKSSRQAKKGDIVDIEFYDGRKKAKILE